ncbi:MAG: hypothetical protein BWY85_01809 [Firmicutes bacterium ADurb.Bin506]|nr:MAG: hypothetical protein BWY85_01809 [Firmicutes bacterium ADurb.Bin506]
MNGVATGLPNGAANGIIGEYQGGHDPPHGEVGSVMGMGAVRGIGVPTDPQGDINGMG